MTGMTGAVRAQVPAPGRAGRPVGLARAVVVGAALLVAALVLGGCAAPELSGDRAHTLQQDVLVVTQAAHEGRLDAARALLDRLRADAEQGREAGEISAERFATIDAALDDVAAELDAAVAEQAAAAAAAAQAAQAAAVADAVEVAAREASERAAAEAAQRAAEEAAAQEAARAAEQAKDTAPAPKGPGKPKPPKAGKD